MLDVVLEHVILGQNLIPETQVDGDRRGCIKIRDEVAACAAGDRVGTRTRIDRVIARTAVGLRAGRVRPQHIHLAVEVRIFHIGWARHLSHAEAQRVVEVTIIALGVGGRGCQIQLEKIVKTISILAGCRPRQAVEHAEFDLALRREVYRDHILASNQRVANERHAFGKAGQGHLGDLEAAGLAVERQSHLAIGFSGRNQRRVVEIKDVIFIGGANARQARLRLCGIGRTQIAARTAGRIINLARSVAVLFGILRLGRIEKIDTEIDLESRDKIIAAASVGVGIGKARVAAGTQQHRLGSFQRKRLHGFEIAHGISLDSKISRIGGLEAHQRRWLRGLRRRHDLGLRLGRALLLAGLR